MQRNLAITMALGLVLAVAGGVATAGSISAGDLIVVDRGNGTLDDVNPLTGASTPIASGFSNPQGLAINAQGMIFVSDIGTSTIDRVNPNTGTVTTFSGNGVGSGPSLNRPFQMAFNSSGTLFVADGQTPNGNSTNVIAIDAGGNRTVVAGNNGSSNNLFKQFVAGLALSSSGGIYVSAPTGGTIYSVTPGAATPLSTAVAAPRVLHSLPAASSWRSTEIPRIHRSGRSIPPAEMPQSLPTILAQELVRRSASCAGSPWALAARSMRPTLATTKSSRSILCPAIDPSCPATVSAVRRSARSPTESRFIQRLRPSPSLPASCYSPSEPRA